jgi:hypothetical protein
MGNDGGCIDPSDGLIEASADTILSCHGTLGAVERAAIDPDASAISWVNEPSDIADSKLAFLLAHWLELRNRNGGEPPVRHAVDVLDLVPAIGHLMVLDVERDGYDAIYRVYGTGIANQAGRDWTGFRVSEMNRITRTPSALLYRSAYRAVFRRPAPLYTEHASPVWVGAQSWRRLILPLSDGAVHCARFLVGNIPVGEKLLSREQINDQQRRVRLS